MTPDLTTAFQIPEWYYSTFFEALPGNSVLLKNDAPKFTILAVTKGYLNQTGTIRNDIVGKGAFEAFPANTQDPCCTGQSDLLASFQQVLEQKQTCYLPVQRNDLMGEDGTYSLRYWRVSNAPVLAPDGTVAYIIHSAEDITLEVRAREQEERMKGMEYVHTLFMHAPLPIQIYKGQELIVELANQSALAYLEKGPEIIGRPLEEVLRDSKAQGHTELLRKVMQSGKAEYLLEEPVTFKDGGKTRLEFFSSVYQPYFEEGSAQASGVLVMAFDVTDKVEARKQTEAAVAEVEKQKRLYETITANTPDLMYVFDRAYRFTYANRALLEMWGTTWQEAGGKGLRDLGYEEWHAEMHEREIDQVVATQESIRGEVSFPHATLGRRIYDYIFVPVVNEEGEVEAIAGTTRDITELKRAEEALRQKDEYLRNLIELAPVPIVIFRAEDRVIELANQSVFEFLDKPANEVLNRPLFEAVPESRNQGFEELIDMVVKTGQPYFATEVPITLFKKGTWERAFINFSYQPLRDHEGRVTTVMAMGVDITHQVMSRHNIEEQVALRTEELAKANQTLQSLNRELVRSNKNLEEFAYAASHDLKEPVRKVQYFSDRLKAQLQGQLSEEQARWFQRMEHAAGRMNVLIEDLLTYSHVSRGVTELEAVYLSGLVQNVLEDLALEVQQKGATVTIDPLPVIQGQERQLQQLFQNLLTNGLKYSHPDVPPRLHITARQVNGQEWPEVVKEEDRSKTFHLVEVRDNGIGFDPTEAERIFHMFTRLHGNTEYKGSGIGLSIARKVVENHQGVIWAQSNPGNGATFYILLPAGASTPAATEPPVTGGEK